MVKDGFEDDDSYEDATLSPRSWEEYDQTYSARVDPQDEDPDEANHFVMDSETAVENLGIGAFCLFDTSGINMFKLVAVAIQGFFLQYTILYFMGKQLKPYEEDFNNPRDVDRLILTVAVYLHIVNCMSGLPFGLTTLFHFGSLKESWLEFCVAGPLFIIDSVVTPSMTLAIGSLYLCTSSSVSDVILNSCAVAFIGNIDNWILSLNFTMNKMGGGTKTSVLYLPHARTTMTIMNWLLCLVPVVPTALAVLFVHIGIETMQL